MQISPEDKRTLDADSYNGASLSKTAGAVASEWNLTPAAFGERGPIKVRVESDDNDAWCSASGATGVTLAGGGADRKITGKASIIIYTTGADDGFVQVQRKGASDASLIATCIGKVVE